MSTPKELDLIEAARLYAIAHKAFTKSLAHFDKVQEELLTESDARELDDPVVKRLGEKWLLGRDVTNECRASCEKWERHLLVTALKLNEEK